MRYVVPMKCPCQETFIFKPGSKLKQYVTTNCGWTVKGRKPFTINSLIYCLLVYLFKHKLINYHEIRMSNELINILWPVNKPRSISLYDLRGGVRTQLQGRLWRDHYSIPIICFGEKNEDVRIMVGDERFLCVEEYRKIPQSIGLSASQLKELVDEY